jgi:hypothetical protein
LYFARGTQRPDSLESHQTIAPHARPARSRAKEYGMKFAGLLVMPAGLFLSLAALVLFPGAAERAVFVLCGLAVEALGLAVAVRGHMPSRGEPRP